MNGLLDFLSTHGLLLLAGVTLWLIGGVAAIFCCRAPLHRQRVGEIVVVGLGLWLVLACTPLPRWTSLMSDSTLATPRATRSQGAASTAAGNVLPKPADIRPIVEIVEYDEATPTEPVLTVEELLEQFRADAPTINIEPTLPTTVEPREPFLAAVVTKISRLNARRAVAVFYLAGTAAAGAWLLLGRLLLARLIRGAEPPDAEVRAVYDSISHAGPRRRPRLLISSRLARPISCGLQRPTIVLPALCCEANGRGPLRHVLLHELAHVRQGDAWSHQLFALASTGLWFHPLYWWVRREVHLAREMTADDWAARHSTPTEYAHEMISLARQCGRRPALLGALSMFHSPSQFYRRMKMLVERKEPLPSSCSRRWRTGSLVVGSIALAACVLALGVEPGTAQSAEEDADQPPAESVLIPGEQGAIDLTSSIDIGREAESEAALEVDVVVSGPRQVPRNEPTANWPAQNPADFEEYLDRRIGADPELQQLLRKMEKLSYLMLDLEIAGLDDGDLEKWHRLKTLEAELRDEYQHRKEEMRAAAERTFFANRTQSATGGANSVLIDPRQGALEITAYPQNTRPTNAPSPRDGQPARSSTPLDLIGLANAYADAKAAAEIAEVRFHSAQQLHKQLRQSDEADADLQIAMITFETARRKVDLLQKIIHTSVETAEHDLHLSATQRERMLQLHEHGHLGQQELEQADRDMVRIKSNLRILQLILDR